MKSKGLLILALVILIAAYWFLQSNDGVVSTDRPFVEVDSAQVTKLVIHSAQNDAILIKDGDGWMVGGDSPYPANERTIGMALKRFAEMKREALVSEREEKFTAFEVDDSSAVRLTVYQGADETTIYLGKAGPTFQTSYARLEGRSEIWEIAGNHRGTFDRKGLDWRDKTINELDMEEFTRFELKYPDLAFTVEKRDTIWHVTSPGDDFDVEGKLTDRLTRMMSRMNTVEFVDTLSEDVFAVPEFQITATLKSGETIDLKLMKKDDKQYFLRKAGAQSDFVIYNSTADALMKKPEDFKPKKASE